VTIKLLKPFKYLTDKWNIKMMSR